MCGTVRAGMLTFLIEVGDEMFDVIRREYAQTVGW